MKRYSCQAWFPSLSSEIEISMSRGPSSLRPKSGKKTENLLRHFAHPRPRKFSYSPSSAIRLANVSDIYKTHIVCSQLLDIKCLSLFYLKLTFISSQMTLTITSQQMSLTFTRLSMAKFLRVRQI